MIDKHGVPFWASKTIQMILESEYGEILGVIVVKGTEEGLTEKGNQESLLYKVYQKFDHLLNSSGAVPDEQTIIFPKFGGADRIFLTLEGTQPSILSDTAKEIMDLDLDILITFSNMGHTDNISRLSRYGLLTHSLGDGENYHGRYAGLWEIIDEIPFTGSHLSRTVNGEVAIVYQSFSQTIARSYSKNCYQIYRKGIPFLPRILRALHHYGENALSSCTVFSSTAWEHSARPCPNNVEMIGHFARRIPKGVGFLTKKMLFEERWSVRFKIGEGIPATFENFVNIIPPPRTWWGDPHVAQQDGNYFIFIEDLKLPRSRNHGRISVIKVDTLGNHTPPVAVLERPYHLSYPFIFQWKGTHYMVPESSNAHTIELYEAVNFPYEWRHVKDIMKGISAVDSTLLRWNGLWWLFCNIRENEGAPINDELFLFYSDDLLTDHWVPHPLNPIVTDVRSARPAGSIFEKDGSLFRPSQDCSMRYGYAININQIMVIDEKKYQEVRTGYIEPRQFENASRVHTFNHIPGITVVDTYMARTRLIPGR